MYFSTILSILTLTALATAAPTPVATISRRATPCFVVGKVSLAAEVQDAANALASLTCDATVTTLPGVPDVIDTTVKYSAIDFSKSAKSGLEFALTEFATPTDPAEACLDKFTKQLNVYIATEAGVRSLGGSLAIKAPKFFLAFQVARIKTAQGITITDPGQTVQHLLGKVVKNAGRGDASVIDQVNKLATVL